MHFLRCGSLLTMMCTMTTFVHAFLSPDNCKLYACIVHAICVIKHTVSMVNIIITIKTHDHNFATVGVYTYTCLSIRRLELHHYTTVLREVTQQ